MLDRTERLFLGIDFSGAAAPWRATTRRPTVWIAFVIEQHGVLRLADLRPVQELSGVRGPFERLVGLLRAGDYAGAAIDAPFSLPRRHLPNGGHKALLAAVDCLPNGEDRPFPMGRDLVGLAERVHSLDCKKPLRRTEQWWAQRQVNVRSTLWNGPRGGAPFAAACLSLLGKIERPCWPWEMRASGLLAEAFPAAQLRAWGLQHSGYSDSSGKSVKSRRDLVGALAERIEIGSNFKDAIAVSPDALDAVVAAFAAIAACTQSLPPGAPFDDEGWIAIHE
jgi:hypothetical protein